MEKNEDKDKTPSEDVLETIAKMLDKDGKNEEEIRTFLEYHFPISSAILQKIMDARRKGKR